MAHTYLIAHIFEGESAELTLGNASNTKEEPGPVVLAFCVRRGITSQPQVEAVFEVAALGSSQVTTAKLATEHSV